VNLGSLVSGSAAFEAGAIVVAVALVVILRAALPVEARRRLRTPSILVALALVCAVAAWIAPAGGKTEVGLGLATGLCLALALIRLVFLLLFEALPVTRGRVPKIVEDILTAVSYFVALMAVFSAGGVEIDSILTASALTTAVVGFALQDTLGNVIAGLAIQLQKPFAVGDWVSLSDRSDHVGVVREINWRATKVLTNDNVEVLIPNSSITKSAVVNFSTPSKVVRRHLRVSVSYEVPPSRVEEIALRAIRGVPEVLAEPAPDCIIESFGDSGVLYWCRYFVDDFQRRDAIGGQVAARLYYEFLREGITIPYPIRTVYVHERSDEQEKRDQEERIQRLADRFRAIDFLAPLGGPELTALAKRVRSISFGKGETIVREGDAGTDFYLLERGEVSVLITPGGRATELARLRAGDFFGEMSLMTGEARKASVVATGDVAAVRLDKDSFREVLSHNPRVVDQISRVLAIRQTALEEAAATPADAQKSIERRSVALMSVIRGFFRL
jgi:small-conductance mechanosensitive channel